jgi:arsenite methyltransferase
MSNHNQLRDTVAKTYAEALTQGNSCCGAEREKRGALGAANSITAKAGYDKQALESLPDDAVDNAFGCGNPLAFSEVKEGQTVIDLGSGAGIDIILAGEKVGNTGKVIGIDMTDEMLERANANIARAKLDHVEVRKGIIEELPVDSATVDWVISNCVINLSPEKDRVFSEIARVLKSGGQMLVSDIVVEELPDWLKQMQVAYTSCVAGAVSEAEYVAGLEKAGLEDVEVRARQAYDKATIAAFFKSAEVPPAIAKMLTPKVIDNVSKSLEGKIFSMKFYGKKA